MNTVEELREMIVFVPKRRRCIPSFVSMPSHFTDKELEKEFARNRDARMAHVIMKCGRVWVALSAIVLLMDVVMFHPFSNLPACSMIQISAMLSIMLISILLGTRIYLPKHDVAMLATCSTYWVLTLLTHRYRSSVLTGEDLAEVYSGKEFSQFSSDSAPLACASCGLVAFYMLLPMRCVSGAWLAPSWTAIYAISILPLPSKEFEGGISRRLTLICLLLLLGSLGVAGRTMIETASRLEFLRQHFLSRALTREKVLRTVAEHEVAQGPFSEARARGARATAASDGLTDDATSARSEDLGSAAHSGAQSNLSSAIFLDGHRSDQMLLLQLQSMKALAKTEFWYISPRHLKCFTHLPLGDGAMGTAFQGKYFNMNVAIKLPFVTNQISNPTSLHNEIRILRHLRHPNIIGFYGVCVLIETLDVLIVEELGPSTSLEEFTRSPDLHAAIQSHCAGVFLGICSALAYLHGMKPALVHGDLKPSNILISEHFEAKLIDFGLSRIMKERAKGMGGTRAFMAPEVLLAHAEKRFKAPACSSDIFSFGYVVLFVMGGERPSVAERLEAYRQGKDIHFLWPEDSQGVLQEKCHALCKRCLVFDQDGRPSAVELSTEISFFESEVQQPVGQECDQLLVETLKRFRNAQLHEIVQL
eukprot:TRINITY_DN92631_c0_g1_i1.p1 TRINITY_DN92631_c0_g1~~TRINITY_DN92631_c0_g1_i1.p1  ORF type:complete len:646 (-),score=85.81 TRINITY_DN92631_c0_g1_i1:92-2029(-)